MRWLTASALCAALMLFIGWRVVAQEDRPERAEGDPASVEHRAEKPRPDGDRRERAEREEGERRRAERRSPEERERLAQHQREARERARDRRSPDGKRQFDNPPQPPRQQPRRDAERPPQPGGPPHPPQHPPIGQQPFPGGPPPGQGPFPPRPMADERMAEHDPEMHELNRADEELERRTMEMVERFHRAPEAGEREKLKDQLVGVVNEHFQVRQERRKLELRRMEEQLKRLAESIERRDQARDMIIQRRISQLVGEGDELSF